MPIVEIIHNAVIAKLKTDDKEVKGLVSTLLAYRVEGAEHMKVKSWSGVSSFFSMRKMTFPAGFVTLVRAALERAGHRVIVRGAPIPEPRGPHRPVVDAFGYPDKYDYQPELMDRLVHCKRMIAQVATGGGKSRCFKLCERRLQLPTLFLTTRKSLMYQMAESYQETVSKKIGLIGDGHWSPCWDGVTFATVDTLASRLEAPDMALLVEKLVAAHMAKVDAAVAQILEKLGLPTSLSAFANPPPELAARVHRVRQGVEARLPIDMKAIRAEAQARFDKQQLRRTETLQFLANVGFLTLEEAHEAGSDTFFNIAQACVNAHYRLALTATPFMRDDDLANKRLMAVTGPIGIQVSEKLLIERGILAKPYFKFVSLTERPAKVARSTAWKTAYRQGIVLNAARNGAIVEEAKRAAAHGLTSMVLVQHSAHGKALAKLMADAGLRARFIFGEHEQRERASALKDLATGQLDCLIGSTILDVGIDVPSVGLVVLAGGGKAEVAARQRIGRGLRAKKAGPNVCFVVDFTDQYNKHLAMHARERHRIVVETPGFAEGVVADFDYSVFREKAA